MFGLCRNQLVSFYQHFWKSDILSKELPGLSVSGTMVEKRLMSLLPLGHKASCYSSYQDD